MKKALKLGVGAILLLAGLFFTQRGCSMKAKASAGEAGVARARTVLRATCGNNSAEISIEALRGPAQGYGPWNGESCREAILEEQNVKDRCGEDTGALSPSRAKLVAQEMSKDACLRLMMDQWPSIQAAADDVASYGSLSTNVLIAGLVGLFLGAGLVVMGLRSR